MSKPYYHPSPIISGGPEAYTDAPHTPSEPWEEQAMNVRLVGHSDLNGWGDAFQVQVHNGYCYVAASGINGHNGMTVLDIRDPSTPTIVNQFTDGPEARTHKVLVINDDILITNSELRPDSRNTYPDAIGGLRIFDISDPSNPRYMRHIRTDGRGIHRPIFDRKRNLLYSSGEMNGYTGKILLVHDMADPANPELIGHGWVPGQGADEQPTWSKEIIDKKSLWLHEASPFGDYVTCGYWDGGIAMFDLKNPSDPKFMWRQNPHETHGWPGAYHSFIVPEGSEFGIVTQETVTNNCDYPPAFVTFYDLRNIEQPLPISTYMAHEIDPYTMRPLDEKWLKTGCRYGAHNIWLDMDKDDLIYICWFSAGLRIIDWSNPFAPKEAGFYIPAGNKHRTRCQSNDVTVDKKSGLIYMTDRWGLGLHILEYTG